MPLSDILGHDRIIRQLRQSLQSGKIAHAYIFEGPAGCGKRTTALALIQALFCPAASDDACGVCSSCRKVAAGNHADIHLVAPLPDKRDISIAQLRDVQRDLAMRPYEAQRAACILEPAEKMNISSANSFLKTLEEPPGNAILFLITENADMLLATIRSRCQVLRFAPLSQEHVTILLERNGVDRDNAALLAPLSNGSVERALELDNDSLVTRRELLLRHLAGISRDRVATIFAASEELGGSRDEALATIDLLLSLYRDAILIASGSMEIVNTAIQPALEKLAQAAGLPSLLRLADGILETRRFIMRNANTKLALDNLFLNIAGMPTI